MNLGQLLAGQKGQLYKVARENEKVLKEDKRMKVGMLRRLRQDREAKMYGKPQKGESKFVPPEAWKDATVIKVIK